MDDEKNAGWMLIVGTLISFITMAMHPNAHLMLDDFARFGPRNVFAHGIALVAVPLTLVGYGAVARRLLPYAGAWARLGHACLAVAQGAVSMAAVASGLIATTMVSRIRASTGAEQDLARALLGYTGAINQAFATVFVVGWSVAMIVWSVAIVRSAALPRWLGWYGLMVGGVLLAVTAIGRLRLDVHHFGLIVLAQGVWTLAVGAQLVRTRSVRQA
ncbi:MAG: hypothetical protein IT357_14750 [Gemmatimonadaceae bacterium]|nr:hypothetical protein [Gemmatimonadaceae bacterium]